MKRLFGIFITILVFGSCFQAKGQGIITEKDLVPYYDEVDDSFVIKKKYRSKMNAFTTKEKQLMPQGYLFEKEIKLERKNYYLVKQWQHKGKLLKLILYNKLGDNDSFMLLAQLNMYDTKGKLLDAVVLDLRYVFEVSFSSTFKINGEDIYVKDTAVDGILFNDDGDIIGSKKKPDIDIIERKYRIKERGFERYYYKTKHINGIEK